MACGDTFLPTASSLPPQVLRVYGFRGLLNFNLGRILIKAYGNGLLEE